MDYTTTELIADLKGRINSPTSDLGQNMTKYLRVLTKTLWEEMVPYYLDMVSNYFLVAESIVPVSGVMKIPSRAIGSKILDINIVSSDDEIDIAQIDIGPRRISGFYFRSDKIILNPVSQPGPFRIYYHRRPGMLVQTSDCGLVTSFDLNAKTITVATIPSTWVQGVTKIDLIKGTPGFQGMADSVIPTSIVGTTLTFPAIPIDIEIGDWVAPELSSPIAQIPYEGHGILAQKAAVRIRQGEGAMQIAGVIQAKEKEITAAGRSNSDPRADNAVKKVTNDTWESAYRAPW